ncbi:hypothetical protein [Lysobacter sp. M2-1]|uniref:hypothetical protein n=1 Tax=Lysobacter sp. M2-1 TaxID=2916839 RepID=UPI001F587328|nr:hypothetical protein [Lysobacter sp. M2-1]
MPGIFISRGMTLRVPIGGMVIGTEEERFTIKSLTLHVRFDVCPTWMELALQHTDKSVEARKNREKVWKESDEDAKAAALEREFEFSMQAVMASAIALDAFYSILVQHVLIPPSMLKKWRTTRTSRYSQVTEVLRRAFNLKPQAVKAIRGNLKEIYRFRDLAVHPSGKIEAPTYHPELDVGVEWRFAFFRASNAEQVSNIATWIIWELSKNGSPKDHDVKEYVTNLNARLDQIFPSGHPNASVARSDVV